MRDEPSERKLTLSIQMLTADVNLNEMRLKIFNIEKLKNRFHHILLCVIVIYLCLLTENRTMNGMLEEIIVQTPI